MQEDRVRPGKTVVVNFIVKAGDEVVDSTQSRGPFRYKQGAKNVLAAFQAKLEGKGPGDKLDFTLEPHETYGADGEANLARVPSSELPAEKLRVGMTLCERLPDGRQKVGRIVEVSEDGVTLSFSHPMAGKRLSYFVEIVDVS